MSGEVIGLYSRDARVQRAIGLIQQAIDAIQPLPEARRWPIERSLLGAVAALARLKHGMVEP